MTRFIDLSAAFSPEVISAINILNCGSFSLINLILSAFACEDRL